ncbi:hypothetical protein SLEP1_g59613, partial [Rubroshorea leprosula]
ADFWFALSRTLFFNSLPPLKCSSFQLQLHKNHLPIFCHLHEKGYHPFHPHSHPPDYLPECLQGYGHPPASPYGLPWVPVTVKLAQLVTSPQSCVTSQLILLVGLYFLCHDQP